MADTATPMTHEQKLQCLALAEQMEAVKRLPGGVAFVADLFIAAIAGQGLSVVDAAAHDALKAENARLTQGLQNIVARYQSRDPDSAVAGDMHDIARATLEGR